MSTLRALRTVAGVAAGAAVFVAFDRWLDPLPMSAATVLLGALVGWWAGRSHPRAGLAVGVALGLLVGLAHHARVHATGRSPAPAEGIAAHLALDAAIGLGVAALALLAALLVAGRRPARRF